MKLPFRQPHRLLPYERWSRRVGLLNVLHDAVDSLPLSVDARLELHDVLWERIGSIMLLVDILRNSQ